MRTRLTQRKAADQTPYPGNVNQPDRVDPDMDKYHNFEQQVNHELPDMRHDWQNDTRNEIGFGIPTVASMRLAAHKAIRISMLLLGNKVPNDVIQAQAEDLMTMPVEAMDRTLGRFADTKKFYAEEEKVEEKTEEVKASKGLADQNSAVPEAIKTVESEDEKVEEKTEVAPEVKSEDKAEEKTEVAPEVAPEVKSEDKTEEVKVEDKVEARIAKLESLIASLVKAEDKKEEVKEEVKEDKAEVKEEANCKANEECEECEEVEAKKTASDEIELGTGMDDEMPEDPEADAMLAGVYAEDEQNEVTEAATVKKAGIKKLGGQPKVASTSKEVSLDSLWKTAPDVNEAFR